MEDKCFLFRVVKDFRDIFSLPMGPRPAGKSLDRIDVNGNYEKGKLSMGELRASR